MRDSDVLDKNPHISRVALEAIHSQVFAWALSRCDYDRAVAEDALNLSREQYTEIRAAVVEVQTGSAEHEWDIRESYQALTLELE